MLTVLCSRSRRKQMHAGQAASEISVMLTSIEEQCISSQNMHFSFCYLSKLNEKQKQETSGHKLLDNMCANEYGTVKSERKSDGRYQLEDIGVDPEDSDSFDSSVKASRPECQQTFEESQSWPAMVERAFYEGFAGVVTLKQQFRNQD